MRARINEDNQLVIETKSGEFICSFSGGGTIDLAIEILRRRELEQPGFVRELARSVERETAERRQGSKAADEEPTRG